MLGLLLWLLELLRVIRQDDMQICYLSIECVLAVLKICTEV